MTPTRITDPDTADGRIWFSAPTAFEAWSGARILMEERSILELRNRSQFHLMEGAELELGRRTKIRIDGDSRMVIHKGATIKGNDRAIKKLVRKGRIERRDQ